MGRDIAGRRRRRCVRGKFGWTVRAGRRSEQRKRALALAHAGHCLVVSRRGRRRRVRRRRRRNAACVRREDRSGALGLSLRRIGLFVTGDCGRSCVVRQRRPRSLRASNDERCRPGSRRTVRQRAGAPSVDRRSALLARFFQSRGYSILDAAGASSFLRDHRTPGRRAVLVVATDVPTDTAALTDFLKSGHKVIWPGFPPGIWPRDSSGRRGGYSTIRWDAPRSFIGVDFRDASFDNHAARPTALGLAFGLDAYRTAWAIDPREATLIWPSMTIAAPPRGSGSIRASRAAGSCERPKHRCFRCICSPSGGRCDACASLENRAEV